MPTFKTPSYSKVLDPKTGNNVSCYTFYIIFLKEENGLCFVAEKKEDICLKTLENCVMEDIKWWNQFLLQFLQASASFFSKPYTVEHINRIAKHTINGNNTDNYPSNVLLKPIKIQIMGSQFIVNWEYVMEPMRIDIPDIEEDVPVHDVTVNGLQELNIDQLPVNSTEEIVRVDNLAKSYDKQRLREVRWKAKLALYKANRELEKYCDKYGVEEITDSDSEWNSSEEEEEEEVQL